jgi:DNA helicase HerA-like ATPase
MKLDPAEWAEKIVSGDVRAASRLMRDIDDRMPWVSEVLKELYPHMGQAYIIGVTGAPGVGKSTLVDVLIEIFRKKGFQIGVVVIAALNLVLDFDFIEEAAENGAPKYMEWYGAFGLLVTLVWLYLEILRLLAKLASRRN